MRLADRVALVTGAAGQLGRRFCEALAREGARVWAADLHEEDAARAARDLGGPEGRHRGLGFDVADPGAVRAAFDRVRDEAGALHVLVNNAGIAVFTPFEERSFDDFLRVFAVNAGGTFLCTREAARVMGETGSEGSIVNIGSIYGQVSGDPRIYTDCARNTSECYGASKAAVIHLTRYFAVHLAGRSVRVNCLSPGGVYNRQGEDFVRNYSDRTPMGRMARDTELAGALVYLASDEASYVTGQNLTVDGGWTAW